MKVVESIPERNKSMKNEAQLKRESEVLAFIETGAQYAEVENMGGTVETERNNYKRAVNCVMRDNGFDGFEIFVISRKNTFYLQRV